MLLNLFKRCYHYIEGPAQFSERPLHITYFMFVAYEGHMAIALLCAFVMVVSGPLPKKSQS